MDEKTVRMLAKTYAFVAEIEAVKATIKGFEAGNEARTARGDLTLYNEQGFFDCNRELRRLAKSLRENI